MPLARPPFPRLLVLGLSAVLALTGCVSSTQGAPPASEATQNPASLKEAQAPEAVRAWLDYDRPADFESLATDIRVPTRDGSELACRLYRPGRDGKPDEGKHPGIVTDFTPYSMDLSSRIRHEYFAQRGYNVLFCNVRGSGDSEGQYSSWFPERESADNYDLIEWLAAQSYSTGHIGQMGESYGSITAYRAAAMKPPHLRTIVPINSPTNIYSEWVYPGGVPTRMGAHWNKFPVVDDQGHASILKSFQDNPTYNDFWQQVATTNKLKDVDVPALHIGGYFDIFKSGGFDALKQRPDKTWLLFGPWTHSGLLAVPGTAEETQNTTSIGVVLGWMDRWLEKEPDAGLPPMRVVSYESTSDKGGGRWTGYETWPASQVSDRRLFPTPDGGLTENVPAGGESLYSVNPADGPSTGDIGSMPHDQGQDQAASEQNSKLANGRYSFGRTVFTLPAFDDETAVAGPVTMHLNASITASDTYFVSKLEVVKADGTVLPIQTGYLRAQLRSSLEKPEEIVPNKPTTYTIALGNTHWRFKAGEKLRVTLSGGDIPKVLPTAPAGNVTINHGAETYVDVPVLKD